MGNISNLNNKNNLFSINEVGLSKVYINNNQKNMARQYGLITREVIPNKYSSGAIIYAYAIIKLWQVNSQ